MLHQPFSLDWFLLNENSMTHKNARIIHLVSFIYSFTSFPYTNTISLWLITSCAGTENKITKVETPFNPITDYLTASEQFQLKIRSQLALPWLWRNTHNFSAWKFQAQHENFNLLPNIIFLACALYSIAIDKCEPQLLCYFTSIARKWKNVQKNVFIARVKSFKVR